MRPLRRLWPVSKTVIRLANCHYVKAWAKAAAGGRMTEELSLGTFSYTLSFPRNSQFQGAHRLIGDDGWLPRLFRSANVDPSIFQDEVMRSFVPQARLTDLSHAREAPVFQGHHLAPALIHTTVTSRVTEAFARIEEAERSAEWVKAGETAVASDADAGWGLFLFSPSPFDEFEQGWKELSILPADGVEETRLALESGADPERRMSDLIKMSIAFEVARNSATGWRRCSRPSPRRRSQRIS